MKLANVLEMSNFPGAKSAAGGSGTIPSDIFLFPFFLRIFEPMRPALFRDWENQNKKVEGRMQLLVRKEGKNGNLFHNPVLVWQQENNRP